MKFRFAASGRTPSDGYSVKNDAAVGDTAATFNVIPTASTGMVQLPFAPRTVMTYDSFGWSGEDRGPTLSVPVRESASRHGLIAMKTGLSPELTSADAVMNVPAPRLTATAAPIAAHREREVDLVC